MKKVLSVTMVVLTIMLFIPLISLSGEVVKKDGSVKQTEAKTKEKTETVKLYNPQNGETQLIDMDEYIFGVVAAEMPVLYEIEALKAQAVAAYTFTLFRKNANKEKDYDITSDFTVDQSYISKTQAQEKWGDKAEEYTEKIEKAVSEVSGLAITYDSLPILAVYSASSCGKTQNAADVWGGKYPYLVSVDSEWDKLSADNISKVTISADELKAKLSSLVQISGDTTEWIKNITKNKAGYVTCLEISGKEVSGNDIRNALDLKSSAFDVSLGESAFTFTVSGYGHGVGMSQTGANGMAKESFDYKEILSHYYTDCKIEKID
ncbi:MAG: stage II sporulation protein D [Clostridia bacterium]|nr:stage II sporulation protein D [Clostridia bacterium]MBQ2236815.1 stage II sporulation protein D [Clostridia bacterium]MEE1185317.1 stage II sporulation protein D [Acutalibacteraceae bacterium]